MMQPVELHDVIRIGEDGTVTHRYWSTLCRHGKHDECEAEELDLCIHCLAGCICGCHDRASAGSVGAASESPSK